jgi:sugar transferase (PEP-CTERM/EpsH1 system associated)
LKPRLLFATHRFPYPPNRGDRIRSYNILRVLAKQFGVTLACLADEPVSDRELEHVQSLCEYVLVQPVGKTRWLRAARSMFLGRSLTEGLFKSKTLHKQVTAQHRERPFDAALIFCSSMYQYVDSQHFQGLPVVVDLVDVDSQKWAALADKSSFPKASIYGNEAKRVRELEQRIANVAEAVTLVSDDEAELYQNTVNTNGSVLGVSNGVDTDYFHPRNVSPLPASPTAPLPHSPTALKLLFTGVLDYPPNVQGLDWFCRDVLPVVRETLPATLDIVGRRPNQLVRALGELEGVNLIGEVPDVRPYLQRADVAISPLKLARGIQNKVLEAMACGLPVVTTTESAEGIAAEDGRELLIADSVDQWLDSLTRMCDPSERESIGDRARARVLADYAWSAKLERLMNLLAEAAQVPRQSTKPAKCELANS